MATADVETVAEAVVLFESVGMPARGLSAHTRSAYHADLEDFATFLRQRAVQRLSEVSLAHLEAYQAELDHRGLSPASRRRKTHTLKSFFRFLWDRSITEDHLAARLVPPRAPRREPRYLSEAEYKRLLRACSHHPRDAAIVELFLQTGMRLAELARLEVGDIELPARPTPEPDNVGFARVTRKGGKVDTIPLNFKVCRALKTWLAIRPAVPHEALFVSKFETAMGQRAIQTLVAKYMVEAGIKGASVHTLRHTMATHHVAQGTDLKTVQETLGHADLATTALYVSLAKQTQRRALQEHAL